MTPKHRSSMKPKSKSKGSHPSGRDGVPKTKANRVYQDFSAWTNRKSPQWHPIKKMRYVFFRMISGRTITDAIAEIHWSASEFWHLIDLKREGPFADEYNRAKKLQGRAFADSVVTIAEGRDKISREAKKRLVRIIIRGLKRAKFQDRKQAAKTILHHVLARINIDGHESGLISRNRLQIDAAKWIAKTTNPLEYAESSKVSLGTPRDGDDDTMQPITIQFVGPDGRIVKI